MKVFILVLVTLFSTMFTFAEIEKIDLNFVAPKVADIFNLPSADSGLIVLDTSEDRFKGKRQDGSFADFGVPTGVIMPFAGTVAPEGFLLCRGQVVSRSTYNKLFQVIGIAFGSGDGTSTFHLPDLRGRFVRGQDNGAGNDPDAISRTVSGNGGNTGDNVGTLQSDKFRSHSHDIFVRFSSNGQSQYPSGGAADGEPILFSSTVQPAGGSETRPVNLSLNYIIKF